MRLVVGDSFAEGSSSWSIHAVPCNVRAACLGKCKIYDSG